MFTPNHKLFIYYMENDNTLKYHEGHSLGAIQEEKGVPSASKSSCSKNKEVEVEEHPRNLLLSKNKKHMPYECNTVKLAIWNDKSKVVCAMCFGDLQWGNILITKVYFVEGLGHNLFSVGQFCDSDLEVAFRRNTCFVINLEGVDLLKGNRTTNLYTINLYEMASASPICLMAHATSTKSCKEKSKRASHPPKPVPNSKQRLHLLCMDLCGPMRIASINGKRYVLVIVDNYSHYTWVHFLWSKDEAPEVIKTFLKRITVLLQSPVIIIRTDNGPEFKNQILKEYFDSVGISHQSSSVKTPQQNRVVERRNWTLVEAARTMLIFSLAPLFLWSEVIATACYTQNHSIIHRRFNKTPYELINDKKPNISFLSYMYFTRLFYPKMIGRNWELWCKSSGLDLTYAPLTITTQQPTEGELDLLFEAMHDDYIGGQPSAAPRTILAAQAPQVLQNPTITTTTTDTAPTPTRFQSIVIRNQP
ncbi:retrovirus-related pol polyprotein from transposon TNT 1-94 [Tanacetum coccineum]|uniref:Retrovirus-related pol polyprotein from transposon TNT 1-94 n=1 Tax=Tanacetum coccineum TaxID=301880 RepID=A0ABQ5F9Y2_9ASTR